MCSARYVLIGVAAAAVACTHAFSVEVDAPGITRGAASTPDLSAGQYIAGVPVFNYDRAYADEIGSLSFVSHGQNWIIALNPGVPSEIIDNMCSQPQGGCKHVGRHPRFPFVALRGTEGELASILGPVREFARYIDLDVDMTVDPLEAMPPASQQGGPAESPFMWGLERVGAYKRTTAGTGVHVYVLDTGIRTDHVEFGGRAFAFLDMFDDANTSTRFCNESSAVVCAGDVNGHGTHCAGTVAGEKVGVAPQAMVHAVKVLSDAGPGSVSGILHGMEMVEEHGQRPAIASMSIQGKRNEAYTDMVDLLVGGGITVVVCAGNQYADACKSSSPAFVPSAITVGSIEYGDVRSAFSNWGTCVDLWAPGGQILSADGRGATIPNNASLNLSGTSMACPHVSGAVALMLEADPAMTPAAILSALLGNASVNYITDLSPADANLLLYVGSDGPKEEQPPPDTSGWPGDEFFSQCVSRGGQGPIVDFPVCMCSLRADVHANGTICYDGYTLGCPIGAALEAIDASEQYANVNLSWYFFLNTCTTCQCLESPPVPPSPPAGPNATLIVGVTSFVVILGVVVYCMFGLGQSSASRKGDLEIAAV